MIDGIFSQPNYLATKKMLDATAVRQQALASNIANLETPGYRRLDLNPSFEAQLQSAAASRNPAQIASLHPTLSVDASAAALSRDGNTVSLENELMQLNQNSIQHSLDSRLITGALLKLRMAITGKPL